MRKNTIALKGPLFFILPVVSFLVSLTNIRSRSSMFVYLAFSMLFGYAISFTETSADSYRYALEFKYFDNSLDLTSISLLYLAGELRDLYRITLYYLVSLFSNNPKVMYAFAGLVYGFFSYKCLVIFVKHKGTFLNIYTFTLGLIFFTEISISNVNGFRFNTAAMIVFLSTYNLFIRRKKIGVLGILIAPLFHYSFYLLIPVLLIFKFAHPFLYNFNRVKNILFYVLIFSFSLSFILGTNAINLNFLIEGSNSNGEVANRLNYVNSSELANLINKRNINSLFLSVQKYFLLTTKIYIFISLLIINRLMNKINNKDKKYYLNFYSFILLFFSFAFIATSIPSGVRFLSIGYLFFTVFLVSIYRLHNGKLIKKIILLAIPGFIFNILFTNIMLPILILSPTFWYGTFFGIIIEGLNFQL